MTVLAWLVCQSLVAFDVRGDGPVRFGFPVAVAALERGLSVSKGELQWAPLHEHPDPDTGRVWIELCLRGASGRVRLRAGGVGPTQSIDGPVVARSVESDRDEHRDRRIETWRWRGGAIDRLETVTARAATAELGGGESFTTVTADCVARRTRVTIPVSAWRGAGVLPKRAGVDTRFRERLVDLLPRLRELPDARGRGDYARSGGVVTNLEYDMTLGFARLAFATGSREALRRAYASARHLVDRDLDRRSGLPFRHGRDHRSARPEIGHCWLRGLLLAGCTFGDRELIDAARSISRSLATLAERFASRVHRARDLGWPLWELESMLRFEDVAPIRRAADRLAEKLIARWDPQLGVLRFGEGEARGEAYKDRCWLTSGILLPALRAYRRRSGDRRVDEIVARTERRLLKLLRAGKPGVPVRYWVRGAEVFGVLRARFGAESYLTLEGLSTGGLRAALRRAPVRNALIDGLDPDDPDLPTQFALAARCDWILR